MTTATIDVWYDPNGQIIAIGRAAAKAKGIGFRYIVTVYDLIPVFQQQFFGPGLFYPYSQYLFDTVASADLMLCVSKSTERDVKRFANQLHVPELQTKVIQLGDTSLTTDIIRRPSFLTSDERFLLSVGTIEARKNHWLLYQVWKLADERGIKLPRLIIAGGLGWMADGMMHFVTHDAAIKDRIIFALGCPNVELAWLYQHCQFTLYPSLYEGWGLPVGESLALSSDAKCNTPAD